MIRSPDLASNTWQVLSGEQARLWQRISGNLGGKGADSGVSESGKYNCKRDFQQLDLWQSTS